MNNMSVLEKILEEIEHEVMTNKEIGRKQCEGMARVMNIIRSHMNNAKDTNVLSNWIPCSEKLPEETGYYLVQLSKKCQMKIMQIEWLCCMTEKKRYLCVMKNL